MPELLPLSALQHYLYCPRQCALIHVEKIWVENRFTAEGRLLHSRADSGESDRRGDVATDRSVPLRSERLGLYGVADVVETRKYKGQRIPYPVEYKRGSPKIVDWDRAQLCAQAICLEEMLNVTITEGAIFFGKPRRRERVTFTLELRATVTSACKAMREMITTQTTPMAEYAQRCRHCSLKSACMVAKKPSGAKAYLARNLTP